MTLPKLGSSFEFPVFKSAEKFVETFACRPL